MAGETPASDAPRAPCSPCRGTGKVVSNLGGSPSTIDCPWCDGAGVTPPGHDAQARHRPATAAEAPPA